jgi:pyrroline-5-carboxylate reductase
VIRGLVRAGFCSPVDIIGAEPNAATGTALQEEAGVATTPDNAKVASKSSIILLGVKPAMVLPVLREIAPHVQDKLIISLAAGVQIASMESTIARARFMRALTNTPSAICAGATGFARGSRTTEHDIEVVRAIFGAIGVAVEVKEDQIDAVTALSGSGPAFVYSLIQALAEGGEKCGLSTQAAMTLAAQTVRGAAQLAIETGDSPEKLIKMVVTPGGTTAAGLAEMEKLETAKGLIAAIQAATRRGREMAKEFG